MLQHLHFLIDIIDWLQSALIIAIFFKRIPLHLGDSSNRFKVLSVLLQKLLSKFHNELDDLGLMNSLSTTIFFFFIFRVLTRLICTVLIVIWLFTTIMKGLIIIMFCCRLRFIILRILVRSCDLSHCNLSLIYFNNMIGVSILIPWENLSRFIAWTWLDLFIIDWSFEWFLFSVVPCRP